MNKLASIGDQYLGGGHFLTNLTGVDLLASVLTSDAIVIAGIILIIIIIYAGIQMVSASGDPQAFQRAQSILTSGIIGFILVFAAWLIIQLLELSTGTKIVS